MATLRLEGLRKSFAGAVALEGLDLEAHDGELLVLVGPSGCGKSTTMRLVAGLDTPTAGRVWIDGRDVTTLPPQERDVAMVFQSYALYPHKTVRENLGFGLKVRGVSKEERERRVREVAEPLGLEGLLDRKPAQLSGGQRQRVALGRAIVRSPKLFLLDEPLSNLDPLLRVQTRGELARLQARLGATMLYVTHDQEEAMTLGDRVAVLRDGRLEQVGPPMEIYARPASAFVAGFLGSPAMNLVDGALLGEDVLLGIRPHEVTLGGPLAGTVELVEALGREQLVHVRVGREVVRVLVGAGVEVPSEVGLGFDPARLHRFDRASGRRL